MMNRNVFQLIDLDRTLFDTSGFVKALTDEINLTEPGLGTELDEKFEAAYKNEETFFLLRHLREEKGIEWFRALVEKVVAERGADSFKLPGVDERLIVADEISDLRPSWGVLTYGDAVDQHMKMSLIGIDHAPIYLSDTPDKAEVIKTWQNDDGTFTLPAEFGGGVVEQLTLEDDKLRAFTNLPKGVRGYWIATDARVAQRLLDQRRQAQVPVPADIQVVSGLFEIIEKIKSL